MLRSPLTQRIVISVGAPLNSRLAIDTLEIVLQKTAAYPPHVPEKAEHARFLEAENIRSIGTKTHLSVFISVYITRQDGARLRVHNRGAMYYYVCREKPLLERSWLRLARGWHFKKKYSCSILCKFKLARQPANPRIELKREDADGGVAAFLANSGMASFEGTDVRARLTRKARYLPGPTVGSPGHDGVLVGRCFVCAAVMCRFVTHVTWRAMEGKWYLLLCGNSMTGATGIFNGGLKVIRYSEAASANKGLRNARTHEEILTQRSAKEELNLRRKYGTGHRSLVWGQYKVQTPAGRRQLRGSEKKSFFSLTFSRPSTNNLEGSVYSVETVC
ncbi:hypothetical protein CYLTODRAFT_442921 [Cylindrobasidium torrendii FP15055 ss-10]|uniref:Uncharacterized protein n=1 Tax=Cylindrobasidium torrendii FP15055 ss-10 TaxID=1314674 RepID=A0A0D7BFM7_9AGAR|nr:hypothetical protein CYLTODRAFT_442921 [Cylindrobasidium torrendii FP15055 ss-10]